METIVSSHVLFLDSRGFGAGSPTDRLKVSNNFNANDGCEIRLSLIEFTCPNRGLLDIAAEPPPGTLVEPIHTIYVQARGVALVNKESATLGGAASNTDQLNQSPILAKIPVVYSTVDNPVEFCQFYSPTDRATSVHLPSPHLGDMLLVLVDHLRSDIFLF